MSKPPGRDVETTRSRRRWAWDGPGHGERVEKSRFGLLIDDVAYGFGDVTGAGLPALVVVANLASDPGYGPTEALLFGWLAMVAGIAVIRGGYVVPPGTSVRGWVSVDRWLVLLRLGYYNLALPVIAFTGAAAGRVTGSNAVLFATAVALGVVAIAAFPWLAERYRGWVASRSSL